MGRVVANVLAWLSAVAMATAGAPTFRCLCPNGNVKSHCSKPAHAATGCCCKPAAGACPDEGPCCCATQARKAPAPNPSAKHSCCGAASHSTPAPSGHDQHAPTITKPGCVQTLTADPVVYSIELGKASAFNDVPQLWQLISDQPISAGVLSRLSQRPDALSEPPDLVVFLRHLII
jgi:hypothetical protein